MTQSLRPVESAENVSRIRRIDVSNPRAGTLSWSPDGMLLAIPTMDGLVSIHHVERDGAPRLLKAHGGLTSSVAFDPTGRWFASGSLTGGVRLWDTETWSPRTLEGGTSDTDSIAFSPDGRLMAAAFDDPVIRVWDVAARDVGARPVRMLEHGSPWSRQVAFTPDGHLIAVGGGKVVRIWNPALDYRVGSIETGNAYNNGVAVHPNRPVIAVGGFGSSSAILLVDRDGDHLRSIEGHAAEVDVLAYTADGNALVSKARDGRVFVWSVDDYGIAAALTLGEHAGFQPSLAVNPKRPLIAFVGEVPGDEFGAYLWSPDLRELGRRPAAATVTHVSAKVVIVGESNVGKSYLAHRIVHRESPQEGAIKSTHGMKFWPLVPERLSARAIAPSGQRREVVLWDMGGQDEYRLVHQLFLHDTTVALVLFDPTRGAAALSEVETWNKYLEKQLAARGAVKLLVGAKVDAPSATIDQRAIELLRVACGFAGYCETSAITGRGMTELCEAIAHHTNWERLGLTSRPELFQRIRDEIDGRRALGEVVLHIADLHRALSDDPPTEEEVRAVDAVTHQLATQGVIARSRVSTGEPVLVLQIQEIERYAGSLIVAARNNPRGVAALDLRSIALPSFALPGIELADRLPRMQERAVLECTVQLMLEHGICFQHEGLLILPSLFPAESATPTTPQYAASLYYDFAGAIDNIYASLVAWLVLAQDFGKVRLWGNRAEFDIEGGGLCGILKIVRPGGFAHIDVYFDAATSERRRREFIDFVEDHLEGNGVEIREHIAITCACGHEFAEETLRQRIARGDPDIGCPVCETRHALTEGTAEVRERDPAIAKRTWALRTRIQELREKVTRHAVTVFEAAAGAPRAAGPIRVLHLSDLHFTDATPVMARLQWLLDDLKEKKTGLGITELDYLVVSGDLTDRGSVQGFARAYEFISALSKEFALSAERCVFVPGNHDVVDVDDAYEWRKKPDGLAEGEWIRQGDIILARNAAKYPLRFKPFSDGFFHKFLQRPYPADYVQQGIAISFWESGLQFLTLNSCWQIDEFHRKRAGVFPEAVANALRDAQAQERVARQAGELAADRKLLRVAVWHHAVVGPDQMRDVMFLGNLQKNGVRIALHGDVHELRRDLVGYWHEQRLHVVGAGSFGARAQDRPESTPRLYNVLEVQRDLASVRVHTRAQLTPDGPWDGWYDWPDPSGGKGRVAYYDIAT